MDPKEMYAVLLISCMSGVLPASQQEDLQKLKKLQDDFSEWRLKRAPEFSTTVGINRYNDIVEDFSWQRFEADRAKTAEFVNELKTITYSNLDHVRKVDYDVFNDTLQTFLRGYEWRFYNAMNPVNFLEGPQNDPGSMVDSTPFFTYGDYINFIARLQRMPAQLDQMMDRMNQSIKYGHTYYNVSMTDVPKQIDNILAPTAEQFVFYKPFNDTLNNNTNIADPDKASLRQNAKSAISAIMNKFRQLKTYIEQVYMPHVRSRPGVNSWNRGDEFYKECLRWHLSLDMTPDQVHQKGLEEVERISQRMNKIMKKLGHNGTVKEFFDKVKNDSRFSLKTADQVLARFKHIVHQEIEPKLPLLFKNLPNLPVVVAPTPTDGPGGMYLAGPADGSRPGTFYLNLFRPTKMVTIDFMALSLHETSPGHHLQGSYASTLKNLAFYRKYTFDTHYFQPPTMFPFYTAYLEGWALYAESLGEELKLYRNDYDLMGRYGSEIFRACRLVVDTGLHHFNWTRERAIDYMLNYTAYAEEEITNEVNRYLTWPGQACAYKIGELTIRRLRTQAEKELGSKFDIKDFHATVLENGALPLNVLERIVNQWITTVKMSNTPTSSAARYTMDSFALLFFVVILLCNR